MWWTQRPQLQKIMIKNDICIFLQLYYMYELTPIRILKNQLSFYNKTSNQKMLVAARRAFYMVKGGIRTYLKHCFNPSFAVFFLVETTIIAIFNVHLEF